MNHMSRVRAILTLVIAVVPGNLDAQEAAVSTTESSGWTVEVTPFVGAYIPLNQLARFSSTLLILGVPARVTLEGNQASSFTLGGRLSGWLSRRLGVEGTFSYAWSDLDVTRTIEIPGEVRRLDVASGASVWAASARLLYRLARIERSAVVLLGAGPAIVSRGGEAYDAPAFGLPGTGSVSGTTDLGGVVDLGIRVDAGSRIAIRLDAEAYLYSVSLSIAQPFGTVNSPDLRSDSRFQADVLLSAGLAFGL